MNTNNSKKFIFFCVVPTLAIYSLFVIYPMLKAFVMAFYEWSGVSNHSTFIAFDNFKTLAGDPKVWTSLWNNIFLLVVVPIITLTLALTFALILTRGRVKRKGFYRTVFFFPNILSVVVISILWMFIYHPTLGILNSLFEFIGLDSFARIWLGEKSTVLWSIAITMVWQGVGYFMILYIAAIEGIPSTLYEVAQLEGASFYKQLRYIIFPLIWQVVRMTLIFNILNVFNNSFAYIKVMTNGGPDNASNVLSLYMYNQAFQNGNFGYAMAVGIFMFTITMIIAFVSNKVTKKEVVQF